MRAAGAQPWRPSEPPCAGPGPPSTRGETRWWKRTAATAAADSDRSAGLTPGMFSSIRHHARDADLRRQGGTGEAPGRGRHSPGSSPGPSCSSALYPFWGLGAEAPAAAAPSRATPLRRLHTGVVGLVDAAVQNPAAGGDGSIESGGFGRGGVGRPWCSCFRSSADGFVTVWNHAGADRESAITRLAGRACLAARGGLGQLRPPALQVVPFRRVAELAGTRGGDTGDEPVRARGRPSSQASMRRSAPGVRPAGVRADGGPRPSAVRSVLGARARRARLSGAQGAQNRAAASAGVRMLVSNRCSRVAFFVWKLRSAVTKAPPP